MKRLSLSLAVVILALSSAVSASDFEEDKQYISCRKGAVNDRQLTACQERLLERLDMSIAKALDRNMTLLAESERITAQRYQSQWESWRQSHCDYSLRKQNDQQHLSLACYLQAARDRLDMLEGEKLETNSNFKVCLRRAGKIESHKFSVIKKSIKDWSKFCSEPSKPQKILAHNQKQYWKINFCGKKTSLKNVSAHHLPLSNKLLIITSVYAMKSISAFVL